MNISDVSIRSSRFVWLHEKSELLNFKKCYIDTAESYIGLILVYLDKISKNDQLRQISWAYTNTEDVLLISLFPSLSSLSSIETNALGGDITSTCKDEKSQEIAKLNYIPFNSGLW